MKNFSDQNSIYRKTLLAIQKDKLISCGDTIIVALSGGPDSICLMSLLLSMQNKLDIRLEACHYNHKLRGEAGDADEAFVRKFCADHKLKLEVGERLPSEKAKSEEEARELRYKFFEKILTGQGREKAKIATAHHMDDLAETFLMRLIRGSGLKGLSSILPRRKNFIRPLLSISKNEILNYLKQSHVAYCQDLTNFENDFFRNKIRLDLLPQLIDYNPQVVKKISETVQSVSESFDFLESEAQAVFEQMVVTEGGKYCIDASEFSRLHPAMKTQLVILCIDKLGGYDYTFQQIKKIIQLIDQNVGKKILPLPYSLRFELKSGKIYLYKEETVNFKENNGKSKKK